ncbi:MAG: hypothetical protein ACI837_000911 [Crocinitomicaceae bacterium]|jgi:hypothetical protein
MDKYLLKILQDANTIIIPGLGALTITNKEKMEIMFMSYLKHDDGKLSGYIAAEDGVDELKAKELVAKYVRDIQTQLDKGESYDMFEFGSFTKSAAGEIEFKNWDKPVAATPEKIVEESKVEKKAATPEVESKKETPKKEEKKEPAKKVVTPPKKDAKVEPKAETPKAEPKKVEKEVPKSEHKPIVDAKIEKTITPIIPLSTEKKVVDEPKAAPVRKPVEKEVKATSKPPKEPKAPKVKKKRGAGFWILMVLLLGLIGGGTYVGLNYDSIKQHIPFLADKETSDKDEKTAKEKMLETLNGPEEATLDPEETIDPEENTDPEEVIPEEVVPEEVIPEEVITPPTVSGNGPFHIVAGTFGSKVNADRLAAKLQSDGVPATVILNGGMNVVSMSSYASQAEANAGLTEMKAKAPKAWVLYKP